jgi:hypothetical protein
VWKPNRSRWINPIYRVISHIAVRIEIVFDRIRSEKLAGYGVHIPGAIIVEVEAIVIDVFFAIVSVFAGIGIGGQLLPKRIVILLSNISPILMSKNPQVPQMVVMVNILIASIK